MATIYGFELIEEREIPELNMRASWFRHQRTGAELLSIENEDENKVFGITLRTPPADSTGLPHILEHCVLSGSHKYPLKDPFRELDKGSLNTFLNAFTYPDKTCYPVASQNLQDFYNLIDVYVDAVFHPLIQELILKQEGWRFDLEGENTPLTLKGVVFNEMKGAYSSPDNLLARYSQQMLFPDHPYGMDSGGDPGVIPDLSYEQFKAFHQTYYHPSNARIFFYGDDDPQERLRRMDGYLEAFEPIQVSSYIGLHPGFQGPKQVTIPYDAGQESSQPDSGRKGYLTVNWALPPMADTETILAHQILAHALIGTPASPLRKALIDSGLGEDLAGVGLDSDLRQPYLSTGLKGMAVEDGDRVESLVLGTLESLARDGIDPDMIAAALNTVEFRLRENNYGSFPRGLVLMLRALNSWLYGGDPVDALAFEGPIDEIKRRIAAGERYFEDLVRTSLLENPHRITILLKPDPEQRQREDAAEKERLEKRKAGMSREELQQVVEENRLLKERQETPDPPEVLALLPSLRLADLESKIKTIPLDMLDQDGTPLLYHDLFTNGIVYLDLGFDLHALPRDLVPYASLFGQALVEMGTESEDYVRLSQRIGRETGGIQPATFTASIRGSERSAAWLFLRGKATAAQATELLSILGDILLTARLDDRERFRQIVLEEKAGLEAQLLPAGHRVVNSRLRARFSEAGWAAEQMGGVDFLFTLRQLAEQVEKDWPAVVEKLESIRQTLLNRKSMLANVTLGGDDWPEFRPRLQDFLSGLPAGPLTPAVWNPVPASGDEGLAIPAQVNYVGKGADLYQLGYQMDGSISVINNFLRNSWLYERVRLQGGAYGVFGLFDHRSGVYTYLSYRDPNVLRTLETFDLGGEFLRQLDSARLSQEEIEKSIIGAIGEMDAHLLPDAKGYISMQRYLAGDTDELRQRLRDQVLSTTLADFKALGEVLDRVKEAGRVVVLGSPDAIQAANSDRPGWLDVQKVL